MIYKNVIKKLNRWYKYASIQALNFESNRGRLMPMAMAGRFQYKSRPAFNTS
jgi:hypothetical protein